MSKYDYAVAIAELNQTRALLARYVLVLRIAERRAPPFQGCSGDIVFGQNIFALRVGRLRDLLMAFGIEQKSGRASALSILRYYAHDGEMTISVLPGDQLSVRYGRLNDLYARLCWSPNGDNLWWHNENHRKGLGACVSSDWPFEYPITGVTVVDIP
jgi:hypothetical protein